MRIGACDPGKQRDSFALVTTRLEADPVDRKQKLYVTGTKRWLGRLYLEVENEIGMIHGRNPFDMFAVEVNSAGMHVYEVLRYQKNLPVRAVTTSKDIKDLEKKTGDDVMDKNEMVRLMIGWFGAKVIVFPAQPTVEIQELKRQLSIFHEHRTETGNVSYFAQGQEHDDLVMALMLNCFLVRRWLGVNRDLKIYPVGGRQQA